MPKFSEKGCSGFALQATPTGSRQGKNHNQENLISDDDKSDSQSLQTVGNPQLFQDLGNSPDINPDCKFEGEVGKIRIQSPDTDS